MVSQWAFPRRRLSPGALAETLPGRAVWVAWNGRSDYTASLILHLRRQERLADFELSPANGFTAWSMLGTADAICITTNGFVAPSGRAVMGRGLALQARVFCPNIDLTLGRHITENGNYPGVIGDVRGTKLVSFPVKFAEGTFGVSKVVSHAQNRFRPGDRVPGFLLGADPEIIRSSAFVLVELMRKHGWNRVLLPRPGCGAGELTWNEALEALEKSPLARKRWASKTWIFDKKGSTLLDLLIKQRPARTHEPGPTIP